MAINGQHGNNLQLSHASHESALRREQLAPLYAIDSTEIGYFRQHDLARNDILPRQLGLVKVDLDQADIHQINRAARGGADLIEG